MTDTKKPLGITDVILRDAHQSLLATRMRLDDMLPIAEKLDKVGFWSLESWGGATFDSCIRYLGEDPWERIRELKKAMPNTQQQMLLRGQNLLGYRHYADDVVDRFCERAAENGVDVFRIFDAMNDPRNMDRAIKAVRKTGKHAQGTIAYTTSPVHTIDMWVELAKEVADMGADSIAIKDMAGILKPYVAYELVSRLKKELDIPIHMQCHATTGMSTATAIKAAEAGIDNVDTAISSMSMTYGHSPTEAVVAILEGTDRDTGLDLNLLEEIAAYFREVRKKYAKFEGSLRGTDSRILIAQVPGGMLTNMENQLREQNASDKFDQVLEEIPKVREDLGFIPLVTPTSQIVGTQAVLNVLTGERYKSISKETAAILKGEYGAAPAPMNKELQDRVLDGKEVMTCRPADVLEPEMDKLTAELKDIAKEKGIKLAEQEVDDVLTYALFPQIGLKFLENRGNPDAFEPVPSADDVAPAKKAAGPETYTVEVNGKKYVVAVNEGGEISQIEGQGGASAPAAAAAPAAGEGEPVVAPLGGNIWKVHVSPGDTVEEGDVLIILEAMKMETEVRAPKAGTIGEVFIKEGDAVSVDDEMLTIA
ncbi:MAG: sodium-extruding oxaloacetate decarboxylase subunit alpha [Marinobacter sp.]|jgi:oxaloacetate decarboxylase alpha subunit|uniref:sodium-extruding oxaloacetate decarboxylase subunit alpha n=1 Tax=Marinobacter TaxID=2742 RepID=UPI000D105797|nr:MULTISPECIES: sodium-extruding oxaloacetate decarboxylase subunit alpha [Marinobacter]MDX5440540.1 sodium-extruding oxaloacetate decarboxylase subunit alpha [Alteromonadaceae bacterium]MDX5328896.1 sodium-extruding oxaloacetate decarboxylase subunit alpha [Marinobacter sp.]MDX5334743.1 sodium-extruding oxaloacetate decarboxylase subunit alpha [Marinobacter sp.]MDX5385321.1 sodium-extruding oxaloacetate decarboxylase subunit alpha [Marinobacter sp.]MDX5471008.1 sodium-extruding oxaloacetate 